jgi:hypothetical protein
MRNIYGFHIMSSLLRQDRKCNLSLPVGCLVQLSAMSYTSFFHSIISLKFRLIFVDFRRAIPSNRAPFAERCVCFLFLSSHFLLNCSSPHMFICRFLFSHFLFVFLSFSCVLLLSSSCSCSVP